MTKQLGGALDAHVATRNILEFELIDENDVAQLVFDPAKIVLPRTMKLVLHNPSDEPQAFYRGSLKLLFRKGVLKDMSAISIAENADWQLVETRDDARSNDSLFLTHRAVKFDLQPGATEVIEINKITPNASNHTQRSPIVLQYEHDIDGKVVKIERRSTVLIVVNKGANANVSAPAAESLADQTWSIVSTTGNHIVNDGATLNDFYFEILNISDESVEASQGSSEVRFLFEFETDDVANNRALTSKGYLELIDHEEDFPWEFQPPKIVRPGLYQLSFVSTEAIAFSPGDKFSLKLLNFQSKSATGTTPISVIVTGFEKDVFDENGHSNRVPIADTNTTIWIEKTPLRFKGQRATIGVLGHASKFDHRADVYVDSIELHDQNRGFNISVAPQHTIHASDGGGLHFTGKYYGREGVADTGRSFLFMDSDGALRVSNHFTAKGISSEAELSVDGDVHAKSNLTIDGNVTVDRNINAANLTLSEDFKGRIVDAAHLRVGAIGDRTVGINGFAAGWVGFDGTIRGPQIGPEWSARRIAEGDYTISFKGIKNYPLMVAVPFARLDHNKVKKKDVLDFRKDSDNHCTVRALPNWQASHGNSKWGNNQFVMQVLTWTNESSEDTSFCFLAFWAEPQ